MPAVSDFGVHLSGVWRVGRRLRLSWLLLFGRCFVTLLLSLMWESPEYVRGMFLVRSIDIGIAAHGPERTVANSHEP